MSSESPPSVIPCPICAEPIKKGAKKCVHCESWFTWWRYLSFSNTALSLLVALVSVLAVAVPVIVSALQPKDAVIRAKVLDAFPGTGVIRDPNTGRNREYPTTFFHALFVNSGPKSGCVVASQIHSIRLTPRIARPRHEDYLTERLVIEPGHARIVRYFIPEQLVEIPKEFTAEFDVARSDLSFDKVIAHYKEAAIREPEVHREPGLFHEQAPLLKTDPGDPLPSPRDK